MKNQTPKQVQLPINHSTGTKNKRTIFTLGHSNRSLDVFQEKLKTYEIDRLIDVRTKPYSRWCPHFNRNQLEFSLIAIDINYEWMGNRLGGLSENVEYSKTIQWVHKQSAHENIVLLCSEADYHNCHRYTMLTPSLEALGAELVHITYE